MTPLAIAGGTLIDGTGADPVRDATLVIEHGRVTRAGAGVPIPPDADVLDAGGLTVMPGIVDCHVHSTYRARDMREHLRTPPTYNLFRSLEILRKTLACGVTTAREMGGADAGFRRALEEGLIAGPRLLVSIVMVSQTGGHGDSWVPAGLRVPKRGWSPSGVADGADAVRRLVRELLMAGADFIKVCTSGGITSLTDDYDEPQMTVEEVRAAVEEAAARRRRVAAHAEGLAGIRRALDGGVYSVEHGWFMDEECVERMVAGGTWWVPTLALVEQGLEHRRRDAGGTWSRSALADEERKEHEIHRLQLEQVPLWRDAVRRGLKVAMGTDQSHRLLTGENLCELRYMRDWLGMEPMDVIVAATGRAAECLERDDIGALVPGRAADVLVVDGDPLNDVAVLEERERLKLVMKGGVAFDCALPGQVPAARGR